MFCTWLAESFDLNIAYLIYTPAAKSRARVELLAEPDVVFLFDSGAWGSCHLLALELQTTPDVQ